MPASSKSLIFVSSVQKELAAERRALKEYVHNDPLLRQYFEVFLFEDLPASGRRADEVYLSEVDRSDVYVGIFGDSYGFEDASGVSPTEHEFNRATSAGKERFVFVKGASDATRQPKMLALIQRASDQVVRRRFSTLPELTAGLYGSLVERLGRTGDIRSLPFDAAACPRASLADLSPKKVAEFLRLAQARRGYALGPETPMRDALVHLNLLDGDRPTHAAVMLFADEPQRFLLTSFVKCLRFHGTEIRKPIPAYSDFRGTVFELVDQAVDFVMSKLDRAVGTRAKSNQAPETYELPREAVSEAIVNAIAHRDYASNASVQIMLFADRLEIWNPGELFPPLSTAALRKPHPSIPRNPLIAEPLFLTRYIERAGTGTLDMIELCRAAGLPPPEFRQELGQVIQILRRPKPKAATVPAGGAGRSESGSGSRSESWRMRSEWRPEWGAESVHHRIMVALSAAPASRSEIAAAIGHKSITGSLRQALADLMAAGFAEYTIPQKPNSRLQKYRLVTKATSGASKKHAMNTPNAPHPKSAKKTLPAVPVSKGLTKGAKDSHRASP
ncbi:MAG: ATP-binding protein [Opitutaceae bacterium]|nr:ATP-binding protein [Opitutaceae bacterium]